MKATNYKDPNQSVKLFVAAEGVVFMPFHFAGSCANMTTNTAHHPIATIPEYKVCHVNLEKAV